MEADEMMERTEAMQRVATRLQQEKPGLPYITYIIMANDISGAERTDERLRRGEVGWKDALLWCGSYSRLDFALRWADEGLMPRDYLLDELPGLWSGSDPDDTDPRFLELWREAWKRAGNHPLLDDPKSRLPRLRYLTVYRGQMPDDPVGIAWSLSEQVAEKFAHGAAVRAPMNGIVFEGVVPSNLVMGYMTGRGEEEVIVCPTDLRTDDRRKRAARRPPS